MYSWNMYGDELSDYGMQMCWFVTIDVLGGGTVIGPSTRQGHPMGGTGRWLPPPSSIMIISRNEFTMKNQLSYYSEYQTIM
jgi:hypothetical protein